MAIDPRDPAAVGAAVVVWAAERFGGPVAQAEPATALSGGLDSYLHRVDLRGDHLPAEWRRPLVVRLLPAVDRLAQARREAAVQAWAAGLGYPAPQVLAVLEPGEGLGLPAQVMERAPGGPMIEALTSRPWRVPALIDQLAALALRLHALPTEGWPVGDDEPSLVDRRLWLPRRVVGELHHDGLARALAAAEAVAPAAMDGPLVACHGDFHPLNVVVDGSAAAVIDWTDAGLGPLEADVARTALLFRVAAIAATSRVEKVALKAVGPWLSTRYRRAYEAGAPLDPARTTRWELLHVVHGWAQVEMLRAGGFEGESSASPDSVPPDVADFLRRKAEALMAAVA